MECHFCVRARAYTRASRCVDPTASPAPSSCSACVELAWPSPARLGQVMRAVCAPHERNYLR
eukprot:6212891-Pleurochrysis_carterae.AAC.1